MEKAVQEPTKIILTGPESTGKTTLASLLAQGYNEPMVQEMSRPYLEVTNGLYGYHDLAKIARLQLDAEKKESLNAKSFLFCDTDLLTIVTWGEFRFGKTESWILDTFHQNDCIYILCDIDVPWEPDPLRENPNDRQVLFDLHLEHLQKAGKQHLVVKGIIEERIQAITAFLDT